MPVLTGKTTPDDAIVQRSFAGRWRPPCVADTIACPPGRQRPAPARGVPVAASLERPPVRVARLHQRDHREGGVAQAAEGVPVAGDRGMAQAVPSPAHREVCR
ncbi:hypothetical protein GCM10009662_34410 [Catellatospora coxensis]|uniref:Uncharacterized protein n=1 Tax=Catellatospora coxensis TaxID=310354 RepID=A0A8J3KN48_9ACTN|nr:hypothetical protein Cco03nite_27270 [Catellatospora coxensis]